MSEPVVVDLADVWPPVLMPSPTGVGPCIDCTHGPAEHWLGEPGGCEHKDCRCTTYRDSTLDIPGGNAP